MTVKCPGVRVKLIGRDGNAFAILGSVLQAMRRAKVDRSIIDEYRERATSGDYHHLLAVTTEYVDVD